MATDAEEMRESITAWAILDKNQIMNNISIWQQFEIYKTRSAAVREAGELGLEVIKVRITPCK